jgi:polysaccharide deacetylase family protein (PEP-CTERM system associated)
MVVLPQPPARPPHFFTVDVEEYFHVNAFESAISRDAWPRWPQRLDQSVPRLLDAMARHGAGGTFFVLGWVADHAPDIVRRIAAAGHEIASHGYWHRRIPTMTTAQFREDLRKSKQTLENLVGVPVVGFRAPSFSILPGLEWAFDVLVEEGFRYDSSLFPIRRRGYGYPSAPREPHLIRRSAGSLAEFPLATASVAGLTIPAAGGGYLRHLPLALIRRAFSQAGARGASATFYIHPWEVDPDQPRVPVSWPTRLRHYRGLADTLERIDRLLAEFTFISIGSALDRVAGSSAEHVKIQGVS